MAKRYELVDLGSKIAVVGPDYASKALFRGMGRVTFETVAPGKSGWTMQPTYRRQAEAMVARANSEATVTAPFAARPRVEPGAIFRRRGTPFCEPCEDGICSQCQTGHRCACCI